jgi:NADH-quinone oxidoreductase subunit E
MGTTAVQTQSARQFRTVCEILKKNNYDKGRLIPILQQIQAVYRYLPSTVMNFVATALKIPPSQVFGVATFYSHFALEPKGKYVVRVCDGTACHVKGSTKLVDAIRKHLKLTDNAKTTHDMLFTVETVSCLGACGLAPVMMVNDEVFGQVTPEKTSEILDGFIKTEEQNAN